MIVARGGYSVTNPMIMEEFPDAVTFLECLHGIYTDVHSLLTKQQLKALDEDVK